MYSPEEDGTGTDAIKVNVSSVENQFVLRPEHIFTAGVYMSEVSKHGA